MKPVESIRNIAAAAMIAALLCACGSQTPEALLASAKEDLAKNDSKAAIIHLRSALQENPNLPEARFLLGRTLLETGDVVAADKELGRSIELKYSADKAVPLRAEALLRQGEYKRVVNEFKNVPVTSADARAQLQTVLASAHLALGDKDAAGLALAAANAAKAGYPPAMLAEARLKALDSDLPAALALVETALEKSAKLAEGWQLKGAILAAQGKPDEAITAYRKAIDARPDDAGTYAAIVSLFLQQGKLDAAAAEIAAAKRVVPKHPQTLYFEALVAYRQRNFAAARDAIQQELKVVPGDLEAVLLAGAIAYELGSYREAEANTQRVLQSYPNQLFARHILVATYLRTAQPSKALESLKPALDRIDNDSTMLALAGEVYMHNGDAAKAAEYFERSAALDPKNPMKRTSAALMRLAKGDTEPAFQELEKAAASDPGSGADLALISAHLRRREFDQALAAIDTLAKKEPDSAIAANFRGVALLGKGDSASARRSFERALELNPAYVPAAANLARLDLADKKPEMARKRFDAVLAKDPKNVQALLAVAELSARNGAPVETIATQIQKAIVADQTAASPRLALVSLYLRNKAPKKAVAAAQDALAVMPDNPEVVEALGRAQQAAGDNNQALLTYNKLAKLWPESPVPYMQLSEVQAAARDYKAAVENLNKALAIQPDLVEAQRRLIVLAMATGQTQPAVAVARIVQKQRPTQSVGYALEGDIYAYKKDWKAAAAAYRSGLKQVPTASELAVKLHDALGAGNDPEAAKFTASWRKDHPKDLVFLDHLAAEAMARKNYASALEIYRTLAEIEPSNALLFNNLAWAAGQAKDPKALEYAEKANAMAPNQPVIMDTLGTMLVEKGDTDRGLELLQTASKLAPDETTIRLNLAKAFIKAGQKDAAKKELDVLAKLGDKFPAQAEVTQLKNGL